MQTAKMGKIFETDSQLDMGQKNLCRAKLMKIICKLCATTYKRQSKWGVSVLLFYSILFLFYSITLEGRRGTTDEFATIPFHRPVFSCPS